MQTSELCCGTGTKTCLPTKHNRLNAFIDVLFFLFVIITELSEAIRLGHQDEINDAR